MQRICCGVECHFWRKTRSGRHHCRLIFVCGKRMPAQCPRRSRIVVLAIAQAGRWFCHCSQFQSGRHCRTLFLRIASYPRYAQGHRVSCHHSWTLCRRNHSSTPCTSNQHCRICHTTRTKLGCREGLYGLGFIVAFQRFVRLPFGSKT